MSSDFFDTDYYRLERDVAHVCNIMELNGFRMDVPKAHALLDELEVKGAEVAATLQVQLPPLWEEEVFIPKRNNSPKGYIKGVPFTKRKLVEFNPNSGPQFAERMIEMHGWQPRVLTEGGAPATSAKVLATLSYPEAATLLSHKIIAKRVTMLTGEKGYLTTVGDDGCLHTKYHSLGCVTGRASHTPNIGQVPRVVETKDGVLTGIAGAWGYEFRSLFIAPQGWVLVGSDMAGLELRCLAHALARYGGDGGAYAIVVCDGDPHATNQAAAGLATRSQAKTFAFAVIYGAGDYKAGTIVDPDEDDEYMVRSLGHVAKQSLIDGIPGFKELFRWLDRYNGNEIPGLDGRTLFARYKHTRLNTMLQAMGAILSKRWMVLIAGELQNRGLVQGPDADYLWTAWVHDEVVIAARTPQIAAIVAEVCRAQAVLAGEYYNLQCPLAANAKIGATWAEIH